MYDLLFVFYTIPLWGLFFFLITFSTRNNAIEINTLMSLKYLPRKIDYLKQLCCLLFNAMLSTLKEYVFFSCKLIDYLIFLLWSRMSFTSSEISLESWPLYLSVSLVGCFQLLNLSFSLFLPVKWCKHQWEYLSDFPEISFILITHQLLSLPLLIVIIIWDPVML